MRQPRPALSSRVPVRLAACLLAGLSIGVAAASAVAQEPPFRAPLVTTGAQPDSAVAGDLDADGDVDIVVATSADTLLVLLSGGDGTWTVSSPLITGTGLERMALGDLDGDGDLDLAHALDGPISEFLVVRLNNGAGVFGAAATYPVSTAPKDVDLADLDGDGDLDAVLPCLVGQRLSVLLNQGDGSFGPKTDFAAGALPRSAVLGDWNADGAPDAAVAGNGADPAQRTVTILLGDGAGGFLPGGPVLLPTQLVDIDSGDFNADGDADLVVSTATGAQLYVLFGTGSGAFEPPLTVPAVLAAEQIAVADLDEDGDDDIAMNSAAGTNDVLGVVLSRGDGTFEPPARYGVAGSSLELCVADLTGDGDLDLVACSIEFVFGTWLTLLEGRGDGSFGPYVGIAGNNATDAAFGDLDGDGRLDMVAGANLDGIVSVVPGTGSGFFGRAQGWPTSVDGQPAGRPQFVAVADFDGDGALDVAAAIGVTAAPRIDVFPGNGDLTLGAPQVLPVPTSCTDLLALDLEPDGDVDLVATAGANATLMVLRNDGTGAFAPAELYATANSPIGVVAAFLDGDAHPDLVVATSGNPTPGVVHTYLGHGDGTFADPLSFPTGLILSGVDAADLDADGDDDVVACSGAEALVLDGLGNGFLAAPVSLATAAHGAVGIVAADLDADGVVDLAVACSLTNPFTGLGAISFARGLGGGSFAAAQAVDAPANLEGLVAHDVDGDGVTDLAAPVLDDFVAIFRSLAGPWHDLGHALAGSLGKPKLVGEGALVAPTAFRISVTDARAGGAGSLYAGLTALNAPFKQGVMVPLPLIKVGPLPLDAAGDLELSGLWPPMPGGFELFMQFWFTDPEGAVGFASTNALRAEVP